MPNETDQRTSGLAGALQGSGEGGGSYRMRYTDIFGKVLTFTDYATGVPPSDQSGHGTRMGYRLLQAKDIATMGYIRPLEENPAIEYFENQQDLAKPWGVPLTLGTGFTPANAGSRADYQVALAKQRLDAIRAESERAEEEYEAALSNARKEDTYAFLEQLTTQQHRDTGMTAAQRYLAFKAKQSEGK